MVYYFVEKWLTSFLVCKIKTATKNFKYLNNTFRWGLVMF